MGRDEIQAGNPVGVSNRPASCAERVAAEDLDYGQSLVSRPLVKRQGNTPALLACYSGGSALLLGAACLMAIGGPRWSAWLVNPLPLWTSGLLGVLAFPLAIGGIHLRCREPNAGGTLLALIGMIAGGLAILVACLAAFAQAIASIDC
jgi:hypothetical protein